MVSKKTIGRPKKFPTKSEEEDEEATQIEEKDNNNNNNGGGGALGYEKSRDERIKANLERMEKLGILDLSRKLKSHFKRPPRIPTQKKPSLPPSGSPRRSSRLKSMNPVSYSEKRTYPEKEEKVVKKKVKVHIPEGSMPELYTEEHENLLGDSKKKWVLYVDGYDDEGHRIYDQFDGKSCHQCRYGENVMEANENPEWTCPACRGICNCSRCRRVNGWAPTGSIYKEVKSLGFKSVAHYLIKTRGPHGNKGQKEVELSDGDSVVGSDEDEEGGEVEKEDDEDDNDEAVVAKDDDDECDDETIIEEEDGN